MEGSLEDGLSGDRWISRITFVQFPIIIAATAIKLLQTEDSHVFLHVWE